MTAIHTLIRVHRERNAQSFVLFTFLVVVMILFMGLGIDVGFAYLTKAKMSKALDSAALTAGRNLNLGQATATLKAQRVFNANYGSTSRDVSAPVVNISYSTDANGSITVLTTATTSIRTYFIRVLPVWKTLRVSARAAAIRGRAIVSLVLDRSGSMNGNRGADALPGAVTDFVNLFSDSADMMSESSFSYGGITDVSMRQPFKADIITSVNILVFSGWTASETGLKRGLEQSRTVVTVPGDNQVKAIVFFTDGLANTFQYTFNCGDRNIAPYADLYDPVTGAYASSGCTVSNTITSIQPPHAQVDTTDRCALQAEAEARALVMADQARSEGNAIYTIGLGDPNGPQECGRSPLNVQFLKAIANTPDSATYNPNQPVGDFAIASDASQLQRIFQETAKKILLRLTQ
jgi:Flp pilus assembly protein TadG